MSVFVCEPKHCSFCVQSSACIYIQYTHTYVLYIIQYTLCTCSPGTVLAFVHNTQVYVYQYTIHIIYVCMQCAPFNEHTHTHTTHPQQQTYSKGGGETCARYNSCINWMLIPAGTQPNQCYCHVLANRLSLAHIQRPTSWPCWLYCGAGDLIKRIIISPKVRQSVERTTNNILYTIVYIMGECGCCNTTVHECRFYLCTNGKMKFKWCFFYLIFGMLFYSV